MIKFEHTDVYGFQHAIRGMRNPFDSWDTSDSGEVVHKHEDDAGEDVFFRIGPKDKDLCRRLNQGGSPHNKFLRQIVCWVDITAPRLWWHEMATYRFGVEVNSCSTMHRLLAKPFTVADFGYPVGQRQVEYHDVQAEYEEEWREVPEHPMYKVSNHGRVWSDKRHCILTQSLNNCGYKKVRLDKQNVNVHRIVAKAFIDNPSDLPTVNHIDGNKWNNNVDNLEWTTQQQNDRHAVKLGLKTVSNFTRFKVSQIMRRFSDEEKDRIFKMYENGMTKAQIAREMQCPSGTIINLLKGRSYSDIPFSPADYMRLHVDQLNAMREEYLETKDPELWRVIIDNLPQSYLQKRTCMMSYQAIRSICRQRAGHKLGEWHEFIAWAHTLPESWLLFDEGGESDA